MPACPYLSTYGYKNPNHTFHISIELLLIFFNIKEFKPNILTSIFSGATERRRKLEMTKIWNQRENEK